MKKIYRLLVITSFYYLQSTAQVVTGYVYSDSNRNKVKDINEIGIPDISVSNGIDVVSTDNTGKYSILLPKNSVLFVIKPANFMVPLDKNHISQSYYLNYPDGSKKMKFMGVNPSGNLPTHIDFPLYPSNEPSLFKALFFGDPQPYSVKDIEYLKNDILAELHESKQYSFATILGDIVGDNLNLYPLMQELFTTLKMPVYYVQGNHDMNYDVTHDSLASETFKANFGPKNVAFNYANVHFVVLDDIIYSGDTLTRNYKEGFNEEAIRFLENDLKFVSKDKLIVLMMHAPFLGENLANPIVNLDKIMNILSSFPHTFSISGHNHTISQQMISGKHGWKANYTHQHFNAGATCGDWFRGEIDSTGLPDATMRDGSPNGYTIIEFNDNTYSVSYKAARYPFEYQMSVYSPKVVQQNSGWGNWSTSEIYVNFFTGSANDTVRMRIDKGNWIQLRYTIEPDPILCDVRSLWDHSPHLLNGKRPSNPDNCYHLWKSSLPTWLDIGEHSIEIEAIDLFNKRFTKTLSYTILK